MKAIIRNTVHYGLASLILLAIVFGVLTPSVQAQNPTTEFTSDREFRVPQLNGVIRFAQNGSYTNAALEGDNWVFTHLSLNGSEPLGNLTISAKNSQITIYTFFSSLDSGFFGRIGTIRYFVSGVGEQTFNLDLDVNHSTHQSEWGVIVSNSVGDEVFLAEGKDWHLHSDNTVTVDGVEGDVNVIYYGSLFRNADESGKPWVEQHSVAIATVVVLAATVAAATIVSLKGRRLKNSGY